MLIFIVNIVACEKVKHNIKLTNVNKVTKRILKMQKIRKFLEGIYSSMCT